MAQLTLAEAAMGDTLKQQGLDAVSVHGASFVQVMRLTAIRISQEAGFVSIDNLRVVAERLGLVPHHRNVWGAVFRGPGWRVIGRQPSRLPGNHAREIRVWEWVGHGGVDTVREPAYRPRLLSDSPEP